MGAVYTVLGRDFAKGMLPVEYTAGGVGVSGFICRPAAARANRSMQHFFVNGRYTRTRTCGVALEEGYRGALMTGKFPSCVLMLTMPCELVDVNVHPAKIEVRFQSEKAVFDAVYFAAKSALLKDGALASASDGRDAARPVTSPFYSRAGGEQTVLPQKPAFTEMTAAEFQKKFGQKEPPPEKPGGEGTAAGGMAAAEKPGNGPTVERCVGPAGFCRAFPPGRGKTAGKPAAPPGTGPARFPAAEDRLPDRLPGGDRPRPGAGCGRGFRAGGSGTGGRTDS